MRFDSDELGTQWEGNGIHGELRAVLYEFDEFSRGAALREPVLTSLIRPAGAKFSWHELGTAADLRVNHYDEREAALALAWLEHRCRPPVWGVLRHDVGLGDHIHVELRDYALRRTGG